MQDEIGAIGHFNMGTFQACGIGGQLLEGSQLVDPIMPLPPASTFAPTDVDVDTWLTALTSFGAKRAVLVVSHGCGFNTFPTRTRFPEFSFEYNYTVAASPWKAGKGDVAADFVAACKKFGVKPGFYYGAMNNAFLNVVSGKVQSGRSCEFCPDITQEQYTKILIANLRQLWTDYGSLAEVWFDGGFPEGTAVPITALLQELQPNAVAFQGPGKNAVRWSGTESGHVAYPFWSTAKSSLDYGAGSFGGAAFVPGEADTCFQTSAGDIPLKAPFGGCWFYNAKMVPKSLPELVMHYHDSIGQNAFMLLDWTPMPSGMMRKDHLKRYQELGDWLRNCYSVPVATANIAGRTATLQLPSGTQIDRVVIEEDLSAGERVNSYTIAVDGVQVANGSSVGHKRIVLLSEAVQGHQVVVKASGAENATLNGVSAFNCSRTPKPMGCSFIPNFKYKVVDSITIRTLPGSSPEACCSACKSIAQCAVFVLETDHGCTLLSANQGGFQAQNVVSGSPDSLLLV